MDTGNFLAQIHEGMKVFDRLHHQVGTVDRVRIGDLDTRASEPADLENTSIDSDARARLLEEGFLRIESRWLDDAGRYVLPEQIMSVSGEAVVLTVSQDELMKRH